ASWRAGVRATGWRPATTCRAPARGSIPTASSSSAPPWRRTSRTARSRCWAATATSASSASSACGAMRSCSRSAAAPSRRTRRTSRATWRASPRSREQSPSARRWRERAVLVHPAVWPYHHRAADEGPLVITVRAEDHARRGGENGAGDDGARPGANRGAGRAGCDVDPHALWSEPPRRTQLRLRSETHVLGHPDPAVAHAHKTSRRREANGADLVRPAGELQQRPPSHLERAVGALDQGSRRGAWTEGHVAYPRRDGHRHERRRVDDRRGELDAAGDRSAPPRRSAAHAAPEGSARDELAEEPSHPHLTRDAHRASHDRSGYLRADGEADRAHRRADGSGLHADSGTDPDQIHSENGIAAQDRLRLGRGVGAAAESEQQRDEENGTDRHRTILPQAPAAVSPDFGAVSSQLYRLVLVHTEEHRLVPRVLIRKAAP